jgi:hypothetical protein
VVAEIVAVVYEDDDDDRYSTAGIRCITQETLKPITRRSKSVHKRVDLCCLGREAGLMEAMVTGYKSNTDLGPVSPARHIA